MPQSFALNILLVLPSNRQTLIGLVIVVLFVSFL
jgi:hypothetical protein